VRWEGPPAPEAFEKENQPSLPQPTSRKRGFSAGWKRIASSLGIKKFREQKEATVADSQKSSRIQEASLKQSRSHTNLKSRSQQEFEQLLRASENTRWDYPQWPNFENERHPQQSRLAQSERPRSSTSSGLHHLPGTRFELPNGNSPSTNFGPPRPLPDPKLHQSQRKQAEPNPKIRQRPPTRPLIDRSAEYISRNSYRTDPRIEQNVHREKPPYTTPRIPSRVEIEKSHRAEDRQNHFDQIESKVEQEAFKEGASYSRPRVLAKSVVEKSSAENNSDNSCQAGSKVEQEVLKKEASDRVFTPQRKVKQLSVSSVQSRYSLDRAELPDNCVLPIPSNFSSDIYQDLIGPHPCAHPDFEREQQGPNGYSQVIVILTPRPSTSNRKVAYQPASPLPKYPPPPLPISARPTGKSSLALPETGYPDARGQSSTPPLTSDCLSVQSSGHSLPVSHQEPVEQRASTPPLGVDSDHNSPELSPKKQYIDAYGGEGLGFRVSWLGRAAFGSRPGTPSQDSSLERVPSTVIRADRRRALSRLNGEEDPIAEPISTRVISKDVARERRRGVFRPSPSSCLNFGDDSAQDNCDAETLLGSDSAFTVVGRDSRSEVNNPREVSASGNETIVVGLDKHIPERSLERNPVVREVVRDSEKPLRRTALKTHNPGLQKLGDNWLQVASSSEESNLNGALKTPRIVGSKISGLRARFEQGSAGQPPKVGAGPSGSVSVIPLTRFSVPFPALFHTPLIFPPPPPFRRSSISPNCLVSSFILCFILLNLIFHNTVSLHFFTFHLQSLTLKVESYLLF
jgi:hypothetical protein